MKKKKKENLLKAKVSIRVNPKLIEKANDLGISIADEFRELLNQRILEHSGKCPVCGTHLKERKV